MAAALQWSLRSHRRHVEAVPVDARLRCHGLTILSVCGARLLRQSYGLVFDMDPLHRQAIVQGVLGTLFFVVLIFWPAGTFDFWQGWLFLGIFAASTVGFTVYLAIYDRPLLERRLKAGPQHEREWSQKIIVSLVLLAFFAYIVLPALDYRYAWSPVAPWVSILGDGLILVSFLFIFWVTLVNSFAASTFAWRRIRK